MYVRTPYLESQNIPNPLTEWLRGDADKSMLKQLNNWSEMTWNGVKPHGVEPEGLSNHMDGLIE
jgi:hypothetical protein